MSVVKERESQTIVVDRQRVRRTTVHNPEVRTKPHITVRTRYIERPATRPSVWSAVAAKSALFAGVTVCSFFVCSVTGHVMLERSRKDLMDIRERTVAARKAESGIRSRVNLLTRADKVEEWAMAHGMAPIDGLGSTHGTTDH
jgi:predicted aminopeptidase